MEQISLGYSLKDIPVPEDKVVLEKVISSWEVTGKKMKWKVNRIFNPKARGTAKKTFGFPTTEKAPIPKPDCPGSKPLIEFQKGMIELISSIEFNKKTNEHQEKLKQDIAKIKGEKRVYMAADKTSIIYLVKPKKYKELLEKNVQKEYKKSSEAATLNKEKADLKLAEKLELSDRVHRTAQRDSFVTLKDSGATPNVASSTPPSPSWERCRRRCWRGSTRS